MTQLSKNFKREEFVCSCGCGFDTVDAELIQVLEEIAKHFGTKILILCGNRCNWKNKRTEGASNGSFHTKAKAADFKVQGVDPWEVYCYLNEIYPKKYGIGNCKDWNHIDVRKTRQRWHIKK